MADQPQDLENVLATFDSEGPLVDTMRQLADFYQDRLPPQSGGVKVFLELTVPFNGQPYWRSQVEDMRQNVILPYGNESHETSYAALEGRLPQPEKALDAELEAAQAKVASLESQKQALERQEREATADIHDPAFPLVQPAEVVTNTQTPSFSTPTQIVPPAVAAPALPVVPKKK